MQGIYVLRYEEIEMAKKKESSGEKVIPLSAPEKYFLKQLLDASDWSNERINNQRAAELTNSDVRSASKILNQLSSKKVLLKETSPNEKKGRPISYYLLATNIRNDIEAMTPVPTWKKEIIDDFLRLGSKALSNESAQAEEKMSKGKYLLLLTLAIHTDQCGFITGLSRAKMSKYTGLSISQVKHLLKELLVSMNISVLQVGGTDPLLLGKHPSIYKVNKPAIFKNLKVLTLVDYSITFDDEIDYRITAISKDLEKRPLRIRRYLKTIANILAIDLLNSESFNLIDNKYPKKTLIDSGLIEKITFLYQTQIYSLFSHSKLTPECKDSWAEKLTIDIINLSISIRNTIDNGQTELVTDVQKGMYRIINVEPSRILSLEHGEIEPIPSIS